MGQSTEELSTQIAGTRESLASDLDALQDRVSPSAIVERRKEAARSKVRSVKDKVMGSGHSVASSAGSTGSGAVAGVQGGVGDAKEAAGDAIEGSPLAAGLIAFGAGLVIAALIPATDAEQRASQRVVEAAQPLVDEAKSVGAGRRQQPEGDRSRAAQQVKDDRTGLRTARPGRRQSPLPSPSRPKRPARASQATDEGPEACVRLRAFVASSRRQPGWAHGLELAGDGEEGWPSCSEAVRRRSAPR